jgi:hypothetical protein
MADVLAGYLQRYAPRHVPAHDVVPEVVKTEGAEADEVVQPGAFANGTIRLTNHYPRRAWSHTASR